MQLEEFFNLSSDMFCIAGTDGYFKKVNPAFCNLLGYSEKELLSKPYTSFIYAEDVSALAHIGTQLGPETRFENRYVCSDGSIKWVSWSRWVRSADSTLIYASGRDVSQEKILEERLQISLKEKQQILDSSVDIILTINGQGEYLSVSKAVEDLWGYTPEELIGKSYLSFLHRDDLEKTKAAYLEIKKGKYITNFENRKIKKDGSIVPISWSGRWSEADQIGYFVARDATERKKQEEELFQSEKRFRTMVQTGYDFISILDENACYIYVSPLSEKLGFCPESLLGTSPLDFIHPDDRQAVEQRFERLKSEDEITFPLFRIFNAKGEVRWIKSIAFNKTQDPNIGGYVTNTRDVTESVVAEIEKEQAVQRLKSVFYNLTDGYIVLDPNGVIIDCNPKAEKLLNTDSSRLLNASAWDLFPDALQGKFYEGFKKALEGSTFVSFTEYLPSLKKWFEVSAYPYQEAVTAFFKDITEGKVQQLNLELEKEVLGMNSDSRFCLKEIVDHYLKGLALIYPEMKYGVNLINKAGTLLLPLSYPLFPSDFFLWALEGIPVHPAAGACGAAAYYKKEFVIEDISKYPSSELDWKEFSKLGILSCCSYPIVDQSQKVISTLAVFYSLVKRPSESEIQVVERICTFLQILIDSHLTREDLSISSERYRLATVAAKDAIYDLDMEKEELFWGEGFQKVLGYKEEVTNLVWWEERIHPEDITLVLRSFEETINDPEKKYWRYEYRFLKADGSYAYIVDDGYIIRNDKNVAVRMVGAMQNATESKSYQQQILKQNSLLREIAHVNSHQIRRPLANILGLIEAIRHDESGSISELINLLGKSGKELDETIREIAKKTFV